MDADVIISAIFDSYLYNRADNYMVELCEEVLERVRGLHNGNYTDEGNIIYGTIVILYGDYGTSPRSGWILPDNINKVTECIEHLAERYKEMEVIDYYEEDEEE